MTTGRPRLIIAETDPYGVVLELRCWSEEEARDLYQRMDLRGRGFAVSYVDGEGRWRCSKEGRGG